MRTVDKAVRSDMRTSAALEDKCCPQWRVVLVAGINSQERGVVASADPGDKSVYWDMGTIGEAGKSLHGAAWERMDWAVRFCPFCGKPKGAVLEAA